jgi:two-component system, OmpR family, response regulator VicR
MSLPLGTHASSQQKMVLIIDDEPHLQEELTGALVEAGFRVRNAYDGVSGLGIVLEEAPDLVVLDLILPKKDGFKVLREMKWREETKDIPVIVLTNLENSDNIELAIRLGAKSYLAKSNYSVANIVEKIQGIIGRK